MWRWLLCSKNYSDQSHDLEAIFIQWHLQNGLVSGGLRKVGPCFTFHTTQKQGKEYGPVSYDDALSAGFEMINVISSTSDEKPVGE